jgi:hypothetical protein
MNIERTAARLALRESPQIDSPSCLPRGIRAARFANEFYTDMYIVYGIQRRAIITPFL